MGDQNSLLVGAGYALGDRWHEVEPWISRYQMVILAIAAAALVWFVVTRLRRRQNS